MFEEIKVTHQPNYYLVEILTHLATAPLSIKFKKVIDDLIQKKKSNNILFDLSKVEFIDSSFIGGIVFAHKILQEFNGKIAVTVKSSFVYDRFLVTQLDKLFKIFPNIDEAETYLNE